MVETLIQQYRSAIDGQLSDRRRVIDHLLDVRLAASETPASAPAIIEVVDRRLADVPGLTTVENSWWSEVLDELGQAAKAVPTS